MRYPVVKDNEWVQPIRKGYRMRCCDCRLVHVIDFKIVNGRVRFRARRDNRATSASRKGKLLPVIGYV